MNDTVITGSAGLGDWGMESDYKPAPQIPAGTYFATIVATEQGVSKKTERPYLRLKLAVVDSNATFPGTEQTIDGHRLSYSIYMPMEKDHTAVWKNGTNAHEGMTRMLKENFDRLGIPATTPAELQQYIDEGDLVARRVKAVVKHAMREDGQTFPEVDRVFAA